jgi:hypothetical protein
MTKGVIAVEKSSNKKIGDVSTTYASQASCPSSCIFKDNGCYAESGFAAIHTKRLNKTNFSPADLAKQEADAIDSLSGKRNMRLHVVGDATTNEYADIISKAADRFRKKHNKSVWSYTHAWRDVDRNNWNGVSILASTESPSAAKQAMAKGYAAAIVVSKYKDTKMYIEDGVKILPCPEMTQKTVNCTSCKLCWNDKHLLANNMVIAFETHSQQIAKANKALIQIGA